VTIHDKDPRLLCRGINGSVHFKKCKQLFEYQHLLLLRETSVGQNSNLYLKVVHFFQ
jgi:hypothetical protein